MYENRFCCLFFNRIYIFVHFWPNLTRMHWVQYHDHKKCQYNVQFVQQINNMGMNKYKYKCINISVILLPVDILDAAAKSDVVSVTMNEFEPVVWISVGVFVVYCGAGLFLFIDGRITSMLSPCGRWIIVFNPLR